jgi:methionyl-tRNA formyltransferase
LPLSGKPGAVLVDLAEVRLSDALRIIFAGSGEFGIPTLRGLIDAGHSIVRIFSQPDRPAGRGKKLTPTPVAELATQLSLPLVRTPDINAEALPAADLMVVIAFGQKIGPAAVIHPRLGSVNLHSSRLPRYRGAAPINWAILDGDSITGNSIIRLAEKMDAGAILAQSVVEIGESETAGDLHDRLSADGAPLMLELIRQLNGGTAIEVPQNHASATIAPKLSRQSAIIDWKKPARAIVRQINGLSPWPGCRVRLTDGATEAAKLTLVRAGPSVVEASRAAGTIQPDGNIACGEQTCLAVLEVQPEGKRPMKLADFRNGKPWKAGMLVESIV